METEAFQGKCKISTTTSLSLSDIIQDSSQASTSSCLGPDLNRLLNFLLRILAVDNQKIVGKLFLILILFKKFLQKSTEFFPRNILNECDCDFNLFMLIWVIFVGTFKQSIL